MLLATNMISVGVDVKRLGLMVVTGQPKTTAEYIQATSRIGRTHPGLVCVVYNWSRPRDLSHYEQFEHYHATFYQQVEALSVTPFAPRALDRGLAALLTSYVRLSGTQLSKNGDASDVDSPEAAPTSTRPSRRSPAAPPRSPARPKPSLRVRADLEKLATTGCARPAPSPASATRRATMAGHWAAKRPRAGQLGAVSPASTPCATSNQWCSSSSTNATWGSR